MLWSSEFWVAAKRIADEHGFDIEPGDHKDHYRLRRRRPSPDTSARKKACLNAFTAAGLPDRWIS